MTSAEISPAIARTWLLVNAARPERFAAAKCSYADQIVLDLEDAVAIAEKPTARQNIVDWLADGRNKAWARINDRSTDFWSDDINALDGLPGLRGVMLAETENALQVAETADRLRGDLPVIALIESARGIENSASIAETIGCFRLAFGSGDYRRDTGTSADDLAMAYPRSKLVVASRIGNLPGPIDGPTVGEMKARLREQTELAISLGLTGKLVLDPENSSIINSLLSPSASDVRWAHSFISDFANRGGEFVDGSDLPRLKTAEKITSSAAAFGIAP